MSLEQKVLDGDQGLRNDLEVQGVVDATRPQTVLRLADGRLLAVSTEWLLSGLTEASTQSSSLLEEQTYAGAGEQVIPLVSEQMQVGKKTVVTGTVRLHRETESFTDTVGIDLTRVGWEVTRVPVGLRVPERPEIRAEGEVTIYPLVEERLVAHREYFLLEEVHVRRVATTTEASSTLELQRDVLRVERELFPPSRS